MVDPVKDVINRILVMMDYVSVLFVGIANRFIQQKTRLNLLFMIPTQLH